VIVFTVFTYTNSYSQINQQKILDYDDYGNPIKVQDANGNITKYYYGSNTSPFQNATTTANAVNGVLGVYLTGIQKVQGTDDCVSTCGVRPGSGDDLFTEALYDDRGQMIMVIDENEQETRYLYDGFGRLISTVNANGKLTQAYGYGYSTAVNGGTYDPDHPNRVERIQYVDPQYYTDFTTISGWLSVSAHNTFGVPKSGESTLRMGSTGNWEALYRSTGSSTVTIRVDIYVDNSTSGIPHIMFDNAGHRFAVLYYPNEDKFKTHYKKNGGSVTPGTTLPLDGKPNRWYTIELQKNEGDLKAWVYPKSQGRDPNNSYTLGGFSTSWVPDMEFSTNANYFYVANLSIAESSQSSVTYLGGLGREIQTQQRGGNSTIISATQYNDRGLPEVVSRPFEVPDQDTYLSDPFGASFNPPGLSGWDYGSHLDNEYDGTSGGANYPFTYTNYESSPMARVVESRLPGGSSYDVQTSYELNDSTFATAAHGGALSKTWAANTLQKTITMDPDGKQTITYTDGWGQTIASGVDMNNDGWLSRFSNDLVTEFSYDLTGNLVRSEDPRGLATTYTYDERNLLVEKKLPDQTRENRFCYDDNGQLRFSQSPNEYEEGFTYSSTYMGLYSYYKYDSMNRPVETGKKTGLGTFEYACNQANSPDFPQNTSANPYFEPYIKYLYDGDSAATNANNLRGRLTKVEYKDLSTGTWGSTSYSYNELGLVEWVIQDVPGLNGEHKVEYTYDDSGRKTQLVYNPPGTGNDHYTWYYYDELGRLEEVASHTTSSEGNAQTEAVYTYGADGQPTQLILGGGAQTVDYQYTVQGWTDRINNPSSMGSDQFGMDLNYSYNGNINQKQWLQPGFNGTFASYSYSYDNANRLTNGNFTGSGYNSAAFDVLFNYDKNGNITHLERFNQYGTYTQGDLDFGFTNGTNRFYAIVDLEDAGYYSVLYDANGNIKKNALNGITSASYDWRNLPYSLTASSTMEYAYDAQGNRVRKEKVGGVETHYIRGAEGETVAVYEDGSREFVNLLANNEVIGIWTGSERRYFLKDHLGSTRTTVNENGNIIGYDDYYPFGLGMPTRSDNSANGTATYKFTGHERDDEADITLDYMMARNYDPVLGRFLQIDPKSANFPDWSPYNYTMNNPINFWDPDGRAPAGCCLDYSARYVALNRDAVAQGKDPVQYIESYHSAQAVNTGTFSAGLASLFIPGPEDAAFLALMATKPAQALSKIGAKAGGAIKSLFRSGDESLSLSSSVSDLMGDSYRAIDEVTVSIKNEGLLKELNKASEGDWVKVYEAGMKDGKKVETHYFRNNDTNEVFDVKKKYDKWHQKEFKNKETENE